MDVVSARMKPIVSVPASVAAVVEREPASWWASALCVQTDPEAFFPENGTSAPAAVAVCRRCEVRVQCLEWALDRDERFGIWGGTTELERHRLRRVRGRPPAAAARAVDSVGFAGDAA